MQNGKPCGQGKPYKSNSSNPYFREGTPVQTPKEYKSGGVVYSDKNDPDTVQDMDKLDEEM